MMIKNQITLLFILSFVSLVYSDDEPTAGCTQCQSSLSFSNPKAKQYEVGNDIPFLPFKVKTSFAGNIPIADSEAVKNVSLYFWMFGKDGPDSGENVVFWLNGGPGCDSTSAVVTENGPFRIEMYGEGKSRPNPYSWTKASTIVYVNFPTGVMFTLGQGSNQDEDQVSEQFISFLENFMEIFAELSSKEYWIVGESYGGFYLPYIYRTLQKHKMKMPKGGMLIDPLLSLRSAQTDLVTYPFVVEHQKDLNLTDDEVERIKEEAQPCGFLDYVQNYLRFPAKGRLPGFKQTCKPASLLLEIEFKKTETFNPYNYNQPDFNDVAPPNYLSRDRFYNHSEVQNYINAPCCQEYIHCSPIFKSRNKLDQDPSLPPDREPNVQHSILAQMIEQSERFTIMHGDLDLLLPLNGLYVALQNLSWAGGQGFQHPTKDPIYNMESEIAGSYVRERKLTFARVYNAGHKIPHDDPSTALAGIMDLLGQKDFTKP